MISCHAFNEIMLQNTSGSSIQFGMLELGEPGTSPEFKTTVSTKAFAIHMYKYLLLDHLT